MHLVAPGAHGGSLIFRSYLAGERGGTWARDVPCPEEAGRRAGPSVLALSLVTPREGQKPHHTAKHRVPHAGESMQVWVRNLKREFTHEVERCGRKPAGRKDPIWLVLEASRAETKQHAESYFSVTPERTQIGSHVGPDRREPPEPHVTEPSAVSSDRPQRSGTTWAEGRVPEPRCTRRGPGDGQLETQHASVSIPALFTMECRSRRFRLLFSGLWMQSSCLREAVLPEDGLEGTQEGCGHQALYGRCHFLLRINRKRGWALFLTGEALPQGLLARMQWGPSLTPPESPGAASCHRVTRKCHRHLRSP